MANHLGLGQTTVKYWLKKHGLSTQFKMYNKGASMINGDMVATHKICPKCEIEKTIDNFYVVKRGEGKRYNGYCKMCNNFVCANRHRSVKTKMIEYKGSKCERCSLKLKDSHYSVFEFHHVNKEEKDPKFSRIKCWSWEKIIKELERCMLVCANCHRIIHWDNNQLK
jgi:hypothetical protein